MTVDMHSILEEAEHVNQLILAIVFVFGGAVLTFWGSKLFKHILFLVGFAAGTTLTYYVIQNNDVFHSKARIELLVSCGVGLFLGTLCVFVYKVAVFTAGAAAGLILSQFVWKFMALQFPDSFLTGSKSGLYSTLWVIAVSILCGLVAFKFMKIALKTITALVGSFMITCGGTYFVTNYLLNRNGTDNVLEYFANLDSDDLEKFEQQCNAECFITLGVWAMFFLSGLLFQYRCTRTKANAKKPKKQSKKNVNGNEYHCYNEL